MRLLSVNIRVFFLLVGSSSFVFGCKQPQPVAKAKSTNPDYEQAGYGMKELGCVMNSFAADSDTRSRELISQVLSKSNKFDSLNVNDGFSSEHNTFALGFGLTISFKASDKSGQQYTGWIYKVPVTGGDGGDQIPSHDGAPTSKARWTVFQLNDSSGQDVLHVDDWGGFTVQRSCFLLYEASSNSDQSPSNQ